MKETAATGLGAKVRWLREQIGLSQAQLAAQAGLSQGYLSQIENGEVQNPSAAVLFRLAQALNVAPRCLLEAAGYGDSLGEGDGEFEPAVDPDLMRYLSRLTSEQQQYLLRFLQGLTGESIVKVGARRR